MEVDKNRLTRNYDEQPLSAKEQIPVEDLYYMYIELNLCFTEIGVFFHKSSSAIKRMCDKYGLEKSKEQKRKSLEDYYIRTLGVKNPSLLKDAQEKKKQTMMEKYGVENIAFLEETQNKKKATCLKKYGTDNPAKVEEFKEKKKQTCKEKYGVEYAQQSKEVKEKQQKTMLDNYGCLLPLQNKDIKERQEQTCLERYGYRNPFQNKDIQKKQQETVVNKYGTDNVAKVPSIQEKIKQTCLERYGVENPWQSIEIQRKREQTLIKYYGVSNISQNEDIKHKKSETMLKHYGCANPMQSNDLQKKAFETKKKNGSFGTSKDETVILELLQNIFIDVETQYSSDLYPFPCDFYVSSIDLYIEYQGFMTHGSEPYDAKKEWHKKIVREWTEKASEKNFNGMTKDMYKNALKVWTITDPLKRKTAKDNGLNWMEFFSMTEFMEWYDNLCETL